MLILWNLCSRLHGSMVFVDLRDRFLMTFDGLGGSMMVYEAMWKGLESSGGQSGALEGPFARSWGLRGRILDTFVKSEGWGGGPGAE